MDYREQRAEVVHGFKEVQKKVIELLEENIAERPLHQLSLSEFNLHLEHRKERKMAVPYFPFLIVSFSAFKYLFSYFGCF